MERKSERWRERKQMMEGELVSDGETVMEREKGAMNEESE